MLQNKRYKHNVTHNVELIIIFNLHPKKQTKEKGLEQEKKNREKREIGLAYFPNVDIIYMKMGRKTFFRWKFNKIRIMDGSQLCVVCTEHCIGHTNQKFLRKIKFYRRLFFRNGKNVCPIFTQKIFRFAHPIISFISIAKNSNT